MLDKFFKKKTNKKSWSTSTILDGSFSDQILFGGRVNATKAARFYRESSAVATAIDTIAKEIEQIEPVIELDDGTLTTEHPIAELLKKPNDFEDYREFIGQLSRNYLLNHDAYVYAEGSISRPPSTLFATNNQQVTISANGADLYPQTYIVGSGMGNGSYSRTSRRRDMRFYDGNLKEIYQIHGFSSRTSNTYADSPLESAALEAKQQILGRTHNLKLMSNGGRLSMAIIHKGEEIDSDVWREMKEAVKNEFEGADNAGKIAVYNASDLDIQELGQTNKDMDFSNLDTTSRDAIYMRYGIPLPIVSPDRQTFNNFDRAIEDLYDRSVIPYTEVLFSGLTKMLKDRYQEGSFERITYNPETINALKGRMLEELKVRRDVNIETTNELRELLPNREPLEGGDIYYQPATLIPAGEDIFSEDPIDEDAIDVE